MEFYRYLFLVPLLLLVDIGSAVRVPGPSKKAVNDQTQSASFWSQSESAPEIPAPGYFQSSHEILQTHPDRPWNGLGNGNGNGNGFRYKNLRKNVDAELRRNPSLSSPEECARACREGEPPKICYYHFTLELYTVLGAACQVCTPNATNAITSTCQCVLADGVESSILTVNRMIPGPSIQVCEGDKVVVDLENKIEGMEVTIHWHGIFQKGSQFYDGVPFVTQCPIHQGNTFRYQYLTNAGTHFWHAHTGLQKMDGIHGSLIVRQPPSKDPNSHLYDFDLTTHVVHISDWMHGLGEERFPGKLAVNTGQDPDNFLINGRGRYRDPNTGLTTNTPLEVFTVTPGKRYRFRFIFSTATVCPSQLTFQGHSLTLIAADGEPVHPVKVDTVIAFSGERYDVVLNADKDIGAYWIQLRGLGECGIKRVQQLAILRYARGPYTPSTPQPTYDIGLPQGVVLNPLDAICNEIRADAICINQLKNARRVDPGILAEKPDIKIFMPFRFVPFIANDLFAPGNYTTFLVPPNGGLSSSVIDGISYVAPASPLVSQYGDNDPSTFCNGDNSPDDNGGYRVCTHKIDIPLNAIVEMVIIDEVQITNLSHPFHLHGYSFNVIGMGRSEDSNVTKISLKHTLDLDRQGLLHRQFNLPPNKDTIAIPNNGYAVIRFRADNPGFWLIHCHFLYHLTIGMDAIIQVGSPSDLPPVPRGFPRCGNYRPPITPIYPRSYDYEHFYRPYSIIIYSITQQILNPLDAICNKPRRDAICVNQLRNAKKVDEALLQERPDVKIFLPFRFYFYRPEQVFKPNTYNNFLAAVGGDHVISLIDEISFKFPPSPPLSQLEDVDQDVFCNGDNRPPECGQTCSCTHMVDIPYNAIVEVVLVDEVQSPNLSHPFHLHGYTFSVIGTGRSPDQNVKKINLKHALDLDRRGLLHRQFNLPPSKDTIAVPNNGYVIFRFRADNPGYWLFHCHFLFHIVVGMNLIVHVGTQEDLPPVPPDFPKCGDHLPAITPPLPISHH